MASWHVTRKGSGKVIVWKYLPGPLSRRLEVHLGPDCPLTAKKPYLTVAYATDEEIILYIKNVKL